MFNLSIQRDIFSNVDKKNQFNHDLKINNERVFSTVFNPKMMEIVFEIITWLR